MITCSNIVQETEELLGKPIRVEYDNDQYKIFIDNHVYYRNPLELVDTVAEVQLFWEGGVVWC